MRHCLFICFFLSMANLLMGQTAKNYVIQVEGESVYVDVTTAKIGDRFSVFKEGEYFTHPVTKKKILRDPIRVADIEIIDISEGYSVAKAIPPQAISLLKVGMTVYPATKDTTRTANTPGTANSNAIPVIIAPAQVNDVVGIGHFGGYVADMLMEQLLRCNKVRLLDRSVLAAQMDEVDLAGDYIDPMTAIQRGKIAGARYILQVTMQKPDVVNVSTGIPLASIMGAVQGAVGKNIGAQYMSNARMENLKASVNISTRVVDLQTGEVVFMCSGSGNAKGKVQMSLEYGALGGAEINGGVDGFKQTVTGKAIQKAFIVIGQHLNKYFNGETTQKVVGSSSGFGNFGGELRRKGMKLYLGTERLSKEDIQMTFVEQPDWYFRYKKAKTYNALSWGIMLFGVSGIATAVALDRYDELRIAAGAGFLGVTVVGIVLKNRVNITLNRLVNSYNQQQKDLNLGLQAPYNGIGICLTF